jgi:hypothetical protein
MSTAHPILVTGAAGRYDRLTHDVEALLGRPATSARDFVARHAASFAP